MQILLFHPDREISLEPETEEDCWQELLFGMLDQTRKKQQQHTWVGAEKDFENSAITIGFINLKPLNHLLFDTENGWENAKSYHPTLSRLHEIELWAPIDQPTHHICCYWYWWRAQSCLWGLDNFLQAGFTEADLIPVRHSLYSANKEKIPISGAVLLRLSGSSSTGQSHIAAVMTTLVHRPTNSTFLERRWFILRWSPQRFRSSVVPFISFLYNSNLPLVTVWEERNLRHALTNCH